LLGGPPHLLRVGEEGEASHDRPVGAAHDDESGLAEGVCPVPRRESYVAVASDGGRLLCVRWQRRLVLRFFGSGI
jgi:hypothetical protein